MIPSRNSTTCPIVSQNTFGNELLRSCIPQDLVMCISYRNTNCFRFSQLTVASSCLAPNHTALKSHVTPKRPMTNDEVELFNFLLSFVTLRLSFLYIVWPFILSVSNLKTLKTKAVKNNSLKEKFMLWLIFNPGLSLTGPSIPYRKPERSQQSANKIKNT